MPSGDGSDGGVLLDSLREVERAARDLRECERGAPRRGVNAGDVRPRLDAALARVRDLDARARMARAAAAPDERVSLDDPTGGLAPLVHRLHLPRSLAPSDLAERHDEVIAFLARHTGEGPEGDGLVDMLMATLRPELAPRVVVEALLAATRPDAGRYAARADLLARHVEHLRARGGLDPSEIDAVRARLEAPR